MSTSKLSKKIDAGAAHHQVSIYEIIAEAKSKSKESIEEAGAMRVVDDLRSSMTRALKKSPLSRHQVAGQMSHLLDEEISKAMIDSWTAASKTDRHIPAEYIPAFCVATGSNEPLEALNRKIGLFVIDGPEAIEREINQIRKVAEKLEREIAKRQQLLELFGVDR